MTSELIARKMKGALNKFAQVEQTGANGIQLFVHTKNEELLPEYFYAVDGQPKKNEDGSTKKLRFVQDILGVPFDMMAAEPSTNLFFKSYFRSVADEEKIEAKDIYVMITAEDEKAKNLILALYNGRQAIKQLELTDLFGD